MKEEKNKKTTCDAAENVEAENEITVDELIDKLAELQERTEVAEKAAEDMKDTAQRLQAEFDNYRRRNADVVRKSKEDGAVDVLIKTIGVMDAVEQAIKMVTDEKVAEGIKLIKGQLFSLFESFGLEKMETESGTEFDPNIHEAIMGVPAASEEEKGTIKETIQSGYSMEGRIVRHAKVIVNN